MSKFCKYIALLLAAILASCGDNGNGPVVEFKEITADVEGYLSLSYNSAAVVTSSVGNGRYIVNGSGEMQKDNKYRFLIALVYPDSNLTTGTFPVTNDPFNQDSTMSFIRFTIKGSDSDVVFIADSGTVTITAVNYSKIKGTFAFTATEEGGSRKIAVKNGVLDILNY